jgi:hypothetical protein
MEELCVGTPKTLRGSINNGLKEMVSCPKARDQINAYVHNHVRDFLNHKLGVLMLDNDPNIVEAARRFHSLIK